MAPETPPREISPVVKAPAERAVEWEIDACRELEAVRSTE